MYLGDRDGKIKDPVLATKQVHRQLRMHTSVPTSIPKMNNAEPQTMVMKGLQGGSDRTRGNGNTHSSLVLRTEVGVESERDKLGQ